MSEKNNLLFINHIIENIEKVEEFSRGLTKRDFLDNELHQYAIIRAIEVIGEATKNIPPSIKKKYSNIPWKLIAGTRDILIHRYFGVDLHIVWDIVKKQLTPFKKQLIIIKKEIELR